MSEEAGKNPRGDSGENDTDEIFSDHPELAPPEGRISVEKVKKIDEASIQRRANTGDIVEDAGDTQRKLELNFARNMDFGGDEHALPTDADDYSRGSGFIGGKLAGEGPSGETSRPRSSSEGFDASEDQLRNIEAIQEEEASASADWTPHRMEPEEHDQGRDVQRPYQATGIQGFGRDIGSSGLDQEDREGVSMGEGKARSQEHKIWAAVLRRLGGSSPGSAENLQLAEKFGRVQFPSDKEGVCSRLEPGAEFRIREGISVDLKQAVERSRTRTFRNLGDLVDCVKDELRRQEAEGLKLLKMV